MSDRSKIEWTDATWGPVTGCTKVSQGCKNCYAEREWPRLQHLPAYAGRAFTDVMCHPEKLGIPLHWTKPRRIFVNSMSDLFHEDVPDEFIDKVFAVMALASQHTFQVLTKHPKRMLDWFARDDGHSAPITRCIAEIYVSHQGLATAFPFDAERAIGVGMRGWPLPNVWLGVSVEDQATADERIPLLLQTPAAVRWVSAEPLLSGIDLGEWLGGGECDDCGSRAPLAYWPLSNGVRFCGCRSTAIKETRGIDWVVAGGESGPKARPMHPDWVRLLRDQCQAAGVPFFFKQWGEYRYTLRENGPNGEPWAHKNEWFRQRVGKKAAGRMIDGRTWEEYPK